MPQAPDLEAVRRWVDGRIGGFEGPFEIAKFDVGQSNPTYTIRTPAGRYVLRRKPDGVLLSSAHAIEREFRVQKALAGTAVPVPKMYLLCEDPEIIGTPFYLMDHVEGTNFRDPRLDALDAPARGALMAQMGRVLAELHMIDPVAAGLGDYAPKGDYIARQIDRWTAQYRASQTEPVADMERLIRRLPDERPGMRDAPRLVHGDYRLDNLLFDASGTPCRAVLDWELSTLGDPLADLAGVVMQWRMPPGPQGRGLAGIDRQALGLPSDAQFIEDYCARRGIGPIGNFGFYLGFCFFRMAAILQGVRKRGLDGNASDPLRAAQIGAWVPHFAREGLAALDAPGGIGAGN
ncbi:phosphotransferase family protein [Profundibacterium mesophilum]|uniref:Acyl-CoA dehydrogenase n=1 Tax=Profundibacterium mesophilum KAUST100406-0324 TaxID=1037889 RepID=A0A921TC93_9RHOB|nr:phosphotransferase family protein [Profundibacterium mesophilum]KAF0674607.1 acyl-CoA dehydrogenase [Profundibacterium mesophilum KAUST100406-0324]